MPSVPARALAALTVRCAMRQMQCIAGTSPWEILLHGNYAQNICDGTYQYNPNTANCQIFHEKVIQFFAAKGRGGFNLLIQFFKPCYADNQDAGGERSQRHHNRICEKVEKV